MRTFQRILHACVLGLLAGTVVAQDQQIPFDTQGMVWEILKDSPYAKVWRSEFSQFDRLLAFDVDSVVVVERYVTEMLSAAPTAVAAAKRLIPQVWGQKPEDVAELTASAIAEQRVSPEGQEGLRAFLEKRKPEWA